MNAFQGIDMFGVIALVFVMLAFLVMALAILRVREIKTMLKVMGLIFKFESSNGKDGA